MSQLPTEKTPLIDSPDILAVTGEVAEETSNARYETDEISELFSSEDFTGDSAGFRLPIRRGKSGNLYLKIAEKKNSEVKKHPLYLRINTSEKSSSLRSKESGKSESNPEEYVDVRLIQANSPEMDFDDYVYGNDGPLLIYDRDWEESSETPGGSQADAVDTGAAKRDTHFWEKKWKLFQSNKKTLITLFALTIVLIVFMALIIFYLFAFVPPPTSFDSARNIHLKNNERLKFDLMLVFSNPNFEDAHVTKVRCNVRLDNTISGKKWEFGEITHFEIGIVNPRSTEYFSVPVEISLSIFPDLAELVRTIRRKEISFTINGRVDYSLLSFSFHQSIVNNKIKMEELVGS